MKPGAGINAAAAAYFLKQVGNGALQPKVFKRWRHKAVADVAYQ